MTDENMVTSLIQEYFEHSPKSKTKCASLKRTRREPRHHESTDLSQVDLSANVELETNRIFIFRSRRRTRRRNVNRKLQSKEEELEEEKEQEVIHREVQVHRIYDSSDEHVKLRSEIRQRRDLNMEWIRRWYDKSSANRTLNFVSRSQRQDNETDYFEEKVVEMLKDVNIMKERFELKLKEREIAIESGRLDPKHRGGPLGSIKANKMVKWLEKVAPVIDLAEKRHDPQKGDLQEFQETLANLSQSSSQETDVIIGATHQTSLKKSGTQS